MWDYTDKVKEHFTNPKNVGVIKNPDGVGMVGSLACGDALKLMFKLDSKGLIEDVKFQTFGCASAIASSSALTELIKGKTLEEAEKVSNQDIAAYLGGLPEQKMHCSVLGKDALLAAIKNYREGPDADKKAKEAEEMVCVCFGVSREEIERVVHENHLKTVDQVTDYTKAGGGCGGCKESIADILREINGSLEEEDMPEPVPVSKKKLTNIQKIKLIEETLEREIRPALKKDGGDIELIDVDGNNVYVSMRGTCSRCKLADFTLEEVVAAKLHEFVVDDLVVINNDALEQ
jgi:NifU-like protein